MSTFSRRDLLKLGVLGSGSALLGQQALELLSTEANAQTGFGPYELKESENQIYSVCLQCNTGCPIKVKLYEGVVAKIDGNPLAPHTMYPHLPETLGMDALAKVDGALCPKGQAGLQTVYDPYRIRKVLKRAGPRGSGKWDEIPFEQAIEEISNGGQTFKHLGDERVYPGLNEYWAVRDPDLMKSMKSAIDDIWHEKDSKKKQALVEGFKEKFKDHLDAMIDPDHPDMGPKNNQVVFAFGRLKDGRKHFFQWFFENGLGTVNFHGHTTICQGSLYFTGKAMSHQLDYDAAKDSYTWTGSSKFYWQGDLTGAEFVIFVGANVFEANYGPPYRTNKLTQGTADGKLKYVVIDPRAQKGVANAAKWIAPKPGTDAAIALGMMRWMFDHERFDMKFVSAANKAAAAELGEPNWTNLSWLVKIDQDGQPGKLLRASELGLEVFKRQHNGKDIDFDPPVAMVDGKPTVIDPNSSDVAVFGDLFVDTTVANFHVKTGLQLLREEASRYEVDGWADIAGISGDDIRYLAFEFTNHGKKAVADLHRGASQHSNGFYNNFAWFTLNALIGNYDHRGGFIKASTYSVDGSKGPGPYELDKLHPKKLSPFGISIIRHGLKYEDTTIFEGYPAKRPWYYHASDVYQEILPSAAQGYPYPVKIMFHYMGSPAYALPAGHTQIDAMLDPSKIGLIIGSDIVVGESYMYADYIVPDLTYLERWEFHGSHPSIPWKIQPVRQPTIAPIPETVKVFGEEMPISMESLLMGLAEKMAVPGFGPTAFKNGMDFKRPEDFYLKMVANIAFGEKADASQAVAEADDRELDIFLKARRHLPESVFNADKWKAAVGDQWRRVVTTLNRGGRFDSFAKGYDGNFVKNKYGKQLTIYLEKHVTSKNAMTGKPYWPLPTYIEPYRDALDNPIDDKAQGYDLTLLTHRVITQTKSRTISNYWLLNVLPENYIAVAATDAKRLGLKDGDLVKVSSASNPDGVWNLGNGNVKEMVGKVKVIQGIRPGNIAFALGYGHWAYGASDVVINGQTIKGDPRRATGVHANAAMRVDPVLGDVSLSDLTGGSVVFYDTQVKLTKVGEGEPVRGGPIRADAGFDKTFADWLAQESLKVARGQSSDDVLKAGLAEHLRQNA